MNRRNAIALTTMLVAGMAVLLLLISFAYAYLLYSAVAKLPLSWQLWLLEIPKLAFRSFSERFLLSLLVLCSIAVALAAAFPSLVLRRLQLFGAVLAFAASMAWVRTLVDMIFLLSYRFSTARDPVSASVSHGLAVASHPWMAWPLIPVLFAASGMLIAIGLERHMKTGKSHKEHMGPEQL